MLSGAVNDLSIYKKLFFKKPFTRGLFVWYNNLLFVLWVKPRRKSDLFASFGENSGALRSLQGY